MQALSFVFVLFFLWINLYLYRNNITFPPAGGFGWGARKSNIVTVKGCIYKNKKRFFTFVKNFCMIALFDVSPLRGVFI